MGSVDATSPMCVRWEWVAGDLTDRSVCPGPFDVIIERRTVQMFGDDVQGKVAWLFRSTG